MPRLQGCPAPEPPGDRRDATVKRETGGWRWALVMAGCLFALAWLAALVTYRAAALGWG